MNNQAIECRDWWAEDVFVSSQGGSIWEFSGIEMNAHPRRCDGRT
jgi:hypothetical protein